MTDCLYQLNEFSGFVSSHNNHCAFGVAKPEIHLAPTHHARINGWCGLICASCAKNLIGTEKKPGRKDARVRELGQQPKGEKVLAGKET